MKRCSEPCLPDPPSSEFWLVNSVRDHLLAEGYQVRLEVSNMGQSIDVVATKNRWITAIEAKRSDWRRALVQCRAHVLVADFITVALGLRKPPAALADTLHQNGWGLLMFDQTTDAWRWEIRPKRNDRVWRPQRRRFSEGLRKVSHAT